MKTVKTAIIGCGTIFPMHAESIKQLTVDSSQLTVKKPQLVAVCDIKKNRAVAAAKKYHCKYYADYKKMLDNESLDAVHICTPHYLHKPMVIEAARRGINILVEKPMALNPKDAVLEIDAAKKAGVVFSVISQNRFNPGSELVKKRISDGKLGKLKGAKLILTYHKPDSYYKLSDWKGRAAKEGGGVVIDQAIHYLDIVRWLSPSPVDSVEANCSKRMHSFIDVEDSAEGIIRFKDGFYLCFYLINTYSYDDDPVIEIDCEKAKVNIIKDSAYIKYYKIGSRVQGPGSREEKAEPKKDEYIDYGDGARDYWGYCHYHQIRDFYGALASGRKPAITGDDALKTQKLVWAIYESSRRGRRIKP